MISKATKRQQRYRQTEKGKIADKKYSQSEKGKITGKKYAQSAKGILKQRKANNTYYQRHKKETQIKNKNYFSSKNGKFAKIKSNAKRKRGLGFILLMNNPFPKEIPVDYHHINDTFVVPVPRQVHKSMLGKNHKVKVNNWIEEIIGDVGVC